MSQNTLKNLAAKAQNAVTEKMQDLEARRLVWAYRKEKSNNWNSKVQDTATGRAILDAEPYCQIQILLTTFEIKKHEWSLDFLRRTLFSYSLPWTTSDVERLFVYIFELQYYEWSNPLRPIQRFVKQGNLLTPVMEDALHLMNMTLNVKNDAYSRKLIPHISKMLGEVKSVMPVSGESWSDVALSDYAKMPEDKRTAWKQLFGHTQNSEASKPSNLWLKEGKNFVAAVGQNDFREHVVNWFNALTLPPLLTTQYESEGRMHQYTSSGGNDRNIAF